MDRYQKQVEQKRGGAWGNTWKIRVSPDRHRRGFSCTLDTCPLYEFAKSTDTWILSPICAPPTRLWPGSSTRTLFASAFSPAEMTAENIGMWGINLPKPCRMPGQSDGKAGRK